MMKNCWAILLVALWSCGGDDSDNSGSGPKTLEDFVGCGGEVDGSWKFVNIDLDFGREPDDCEGSKTELTDLSFVGTITFRVDDTFSMDAVASFKEIETKSIDCFEPVPESCEEVDDSCMDGTGGDCECTDERTFNFEEDGDWILSGNTVSLDNDGRVIDYAFCVEGNVLQLKGTEDSTSFLYTAERQ